MTGWAAATKALDLTTGQRHPGVPPAIEEALQDLYDAGYNGYARQRERFFAAKYFPPIDILMKAWYDVDFVKSYLVVLGNRRVASSGSTNYMSRHHNAPTLLDDVVEVAVAGRSSDQRVSAPNGGLRSTVRSGSTSTS
jgi:hypothetical protein